jgi:hypothetical protein
MVMSILNNGGTAGGGDGVALASVAHPVEITSEMMAAGLAASEATWKPGNGWPDMVRAVYQAMAVLAPSAPDDISEDATVEIEHPLYSLIRVIKTDCERTDPDDPIEQRKLVSRIYGAVCKVAR